MWVGMSLRDAVARAGSFEALLPHLKSGHIMARAAGFYTAEGAPKEREDGRISAQWWRQLRDIDPTAGRAWFEMVLADQIADELLQRTRHPELTTRDPVVTDDVLLAIGIELEQAAVEALFPEATVSASALRHAGGRPLEHNWEGAAQHVDRSVAKHGLLPRDEKGEPIKVRAVDLMTEWFKDNDPPPPNKEDIYRWLREHPQRCQKWWDCQN